MTGGHVSSLRPETGEALRSPVNIGVRDYWLSLRGKTGLPSWSAFNPAAVRSWLSQIVVVDVDQPSGNLRYRLIGTGVTEIAGRDATGRSLDAELYGDRLDEMTWTYRRCAQSGEPLATVGRVHFARREWVTLEHLFVPFTRDSGGVEVILSSLAALPEDTRLQLLDPRSELVLDWRL